MKIFILITAIFTTQAYIFAHTCESGAYNINHNMKYKENLTDVLFIKTEIDKKQKLIRVYPLVADFRNGLSKVLENKKNIIKSVEFQKKKCLLNENFILPFVDKMGDLMEPAAINLKKCSDNFVNNLEDGYMRYFHKEGKVWLSKKVEIKKVYNKKFKELQRDLLEKTEKNEFRIYSEAFSKIKSLPLKKVHMVNYNTPDVISYKLGSNVELIKISYEIKDLEYLMSISSMVNTLKEIPSYLRTKKAWLKTNPERDDYFKFKEKITANFPFLFLKIGKDKAKLIGDGAWCSDNKVYYEFGLYKRKKIFKQNIGNLKEFKITGAFDVSGDGNTDLIELDEQFVFYIHPDKTLEVVEFCSGF